MYLNKQPHSPPPRKKISFVKEGEEEIPSTPMKKRFGLLDIARDWFCKFDLPEDMKSLVFPQYICYTSFRPDGYIMSLSAKICVLIELTAPLEENIPKWNRKKFAKYEEEILQHAASDWNVSCLCIEIGAKGYVPPTVRQHLRRIGVPKKLIKRCLQQAGHMAAKSSYVIWNHRENKDFEPWRIPVKV